MAGAPPKAGQTVKIAAGVIGDGTDITVTGAPLGSLTATSVGDGTVTAPSVGTINARGKAKTRLTAAIPGDFNANVVASGVGVRRAMYLPIPIPRENGRTGAIARAGNRACNKRGRCRRYPHCGRVVTDEAVWARPTCPAGEW